jgi:hypothetical protein
MMNRIVMKVMVLMTPKLSDCLVVSGYGERLLLNLFNERVLGRVYLMSNHKFS